VQDAQQPKKRGAASFFVLLLYFLCGFEAYSLLTINDALQFLLNAFWQCANAHRGSSSLRLFKRN